MIRLALAALFGLLLLPLPVAGAKPAPLKVAVVDLRVHLPYQLVSKGRAMALGSGQADLARMRHGGVYGVVLPLLGTPLASSSQSRPVRANRGAGSFSVAV